MTASRVNRASTRSTSKAFVAAISVLARLRKGSSFRAITQLRAASFCRQTQGCNHRGPGLAPRSSAGRSEAARQAAESQWHRPPPPWRAPCYSLFGVGGEANVHSASSGRALPQPEEHATFRAKAFEVWMAHRAVFAVVVVSSSDA